LVSQDRVEKAAQEYLRALISTSPASMVVRAILLGDSGNFTSGELAEISRGGSRPGPTTPVANMGRSTKVPVLKRKRTVSRYQKVFGKHLKALKKKHPRSKISVLMKKAHRLTKKEMKK
jgi:hypothetical protein